MHRVAFISDLHLEEEYPQENNVETETNWSVILQDLEIEKIMEIVIGSDLGTTASHQKVFASQGRKN